MKKCKIDLILAEINLLRGRLKYPQIGYLYYANIAGDGRNYRTVYAITGNGGGVSAVHNGHTPKATLENLRQLHAQLQAEPPKDTPQTDAEWLRYADYWWDEIAEFCGLDPSFVGAYTDAAAISYARNFHEVGA